MMLAGSGPYVDEPVQIGVDGLSDGDVELDALRLAMQALAPLDAAERARVVAYLAARYEADA
jgi:hypothetical protein